METKGGGEVSPEQPSPELIGNHGAWQAHRLFQSAALPTGSPMPASLRRETPSTSRLSVSPCKAWPAEERKEEEEEEAVVAVPAHQSPSHAYPSLLASVTLRQVAQG